MTDEWWNKIYETAALDMHDAYVNRLLNEFKYLCEKTNQEDASSDTPSFGDETS